MEIECVIRPDVPTINGRIYPEAVLLAAIEDYRKTSIETKRAVVATPRDFGVFGAGGWVGVVKDMRIEDGKILLNFNFVCHDEMRIAIEKGNYKFDIHSHAYVDADLVISDMKIQSIVLLQED